MRSVVAVGSLGYTLVNDAQCCFRCVLERNTQRFFFLCGEGTQYPVRQILLGVRFGAHADLYPGKILAAQLLDNGLDAIVAAGTSVSADTQPPGRQGDVVEHDDDALRRNVKVGTQLQHGPTGQIHIGQRL